MPIRLALFALAVAVWSCGDDSDPAPPAPLRPSGELKTWDLSPIVSADEVRAMPPGTPIFMRTEFANGELADLEMTFVQVVDDYLAPMPVYMVEASDPVLIQLEGIAQGMSGSPVFTEQGTWGAIAYGFSGQDSPPYYFFATPIEWVIGTRGTLPSAKRTATWEGNVITPLDTPLLSTGLNGGRLLPDGWSLLSAAGLTQERQASFEAGRPLAVGLLLGELTLSSLGTISYVDGNRVYGFGHPMTGRGAVSLPIIEAKVLGEISNVSAPFKFATLNPTVRGTLKEDRLPAVRGVLDEEPDLVPIKSVYALPSGRTVELAHRMAVGIPPDDALAMVSRAFFFPLASRVDNDLEHSIRVTTDIAFSGSDSMLTLARLYSTPEGQLEASISEAVRDVAKALSELMTRDDYGLSVRVAEVHVEVIPETRFATVTKVTADSVISLGSLLDITTLLRVGRAEDREVQLALSVPDTLPPGFYQLEVGSAALLGDVGDDAPLLGSSSFGSPSEETLDDVFARLNKPDERVLLKARLALGEPDPPAFFDPRLQGEGGGGEPEGAFGGVPPLGSFSPGPPPLAPEPVSTQEDVGLMLQGVKVLEIEVVAVE